MTVATAGRDRPILFSGPMVRAILAGRKTQTRRVIVGFDIRGPNPPGLFDVYRLKGPGAGWCGAFKPGDDQTRSGFVQTECPYGRSGDRLWVREAWQAYNPGTDEMQDPALHANGYIFSLGYRATDEDRAREHKRPAWPGPWRRAIHMPRWASRLTLEITEVRVQRLQDISEEDAKAEGVRELPLQEGAAGAWWTADVAAGLKLQGRTPRSAFKLAWDEINMKRAPLARNPWVWCLSFRRLA